MCSYLIIFAPPLFYQDIMYPKRVTFLPVQHFSVLSYSFSTVGRFEQHPANILEASYINLAFALLNSERQNQAMDVINGGLEILPLSYRLMHAKARLLLFKRQVKIS